MSDEAPAPGPALPTFEPHERVCGNCKLWRAHSLDAVKGWVGNCRVQPNRGLFVPAAPLCDAFVGRHETVTATASAVVARARALKPIGPLVRRADGREQLVDAPSRVAAVDPSTPIDFEGDSMTRQELMELFLEASGLADVPLAGKWEGGTVRLIPADEKLQAKDLPIDAIFHKVVMVRDRLRTLEQKINGHPKLSDTDKVDMQQYVTRCYGSLTTFNVLFKDKADQFVGQKDGKDD
ncbi:MAG: hypothetical protein Q8L48_28865 [Archangium sp.]|nr:hypothetical protein [Archangium sp.]